jgi:hypothetical protein
MKNNFSLFNDVQIILSKSKTFEKIFQTRMNTFHKSSRPSLSGSFFTSHLSFKRSFFGSFSFFISFKK